MHITCLYVLFVHIKHIMPEWCTSGLPHCLAPAYESECEGHLFTGSNCVSYFILNPGHAQAVASLWSPNISTFDLQGGLVYSQC